MLAMKTTNVMRWAIPSLVLSLFTILFIQSSSSPLQSTDASPLQRAQHWIKSPLQQVIQEPTTTVTTTVTATIAAISTPKTKPSYIPGKADPHKTYRKALIVSSIKKENTSWIAQSVPDVDAYIYVNDDPDAILTVPKNKFNEVMTYLTFIIDHYDRLPEIMIFIHAHARTHHNPAMMGMTADLVNNLNPQRVMREGYMNLNCGAWKTGECTAQMRPAEGVPFGSHIEAWKALFPEYPLPQILGGSCCAQFAVSKERVRQIPLETFKRWRSWLLETKMGGMGFFFEYLWQFIFKGEHVYCPASWSCYCDGFGLCFGGEAEYLKYVRLQSGKDRLIQGVDEINAKGREGIEASEDGKYDLPDAEAKRRVSFRKAIEDIDIEIKRMLTIAKERGNNPKLRAEELGRKWEEGDGFI
ncbi:uncharacterized protein MYCFIDRAFT_212224 [Pseudocercospora fijiensis CIRAD86]|uniref:Uncharacterized protein n=1 Tax=Pseudocercospora fijiensis (strain CIRAD86) TaxID=383855 RepID=M3APR8_PSEFD|nr:uncharacterized protein MYCFIDRAFT_212224 [Pseudocercospora fijiensis CIRAD86]EME79442.1 hypothetical protein MYCFIDRAFT_212224 [Pseudocercospora fijiensis CIRAD86]